MAIPDVLLVDGHYLLYRAWYGFPARIYASDRTDRTGVFGFVALLRKALRQHAPGQECVVVFDAEDGAAARTASDSAYKAQRPPADPGLFESLGPIKQVLDGAGVRWLEHSGAEADDVIATLALRARAGGREVTVMSTDKDYSQLLGDTGIRLLNTGAAEHRRETTGADVIARYGVAPVQWPDFRALMGDPADNISGVLGIGERTAARLLAGGRHLEHIPPAEIRPAWADQWPNAIRWREMIRLCDCKDQFPGDALAAISTSPLPAARDLLAAHGLW